MPQLLTVASIRKSCPSFRVLDGGKAPKAPFSLQLIDAPGLASTLRAKLESVPVTWDDVVDGISECDTCHVVTIAPSQIERTDSEGKALIGKDGKPQFTTYRTVATVKGSEIAALLRTGSASPKRRNRKPEADNGADNVSADTTVTAPPANVSTAS
jgi:hypothetical protein